MVKRSRYGGVLKVTVACKMTDYIGTAPGVSAIKESEAPLQYLETRSGRVHLSCSGQKPASRYGEYRRRIY